MAPRRQKQCIFCSNPANSKEHFWPGWMHALLPQLPDPRHNRKIHNYRPSTGKQEEGVTDRPGALHTVKIRVVCEPCNIGWMNRLEQDVRPFLTPLIEGAPVALDFEQMGVIARWIAVKCLVAEHATRHTCVTPESDRFALRKHGTIPDYFRIYVANHNSQHGIGFLRHSLGISLNGPVSDPPPWGTPKNVQTISFLLGRIFVHLNAARIDNYSIESRYRVIPPFWDHCRIWPLQHCEMVWPRQPLLDSNGIASISGALQAIVAASTLHWGDLPKHRS